MPSLLQAHVPLNVVITLITDSVFNCLNKRIEQFEILILHPLSLILFSIG